MKYLLIYPQLMQFFYPCLKSQTLCVNKVGIKFHTHSCWPIKLLKLKLMIVRSPFYLTASKFYIEQVGQILPSDDSKLFNKR